MSSMLRSLQRKTRRRTHYDLVLSDPTDDETREMDEATSALRLARLKDGEGTEAFTAAQRRWEAARDALRAHVLRITFEGIPEHELETLRSAPEHAPTEQQLAEHEKAVAEAKADDEKPPAPPLFNLDTLMPVLFARCVVPDDGDEPLTAEQWAEVLRPDGDWQEKERIAAFNTCVAATLYLRSVEIPKG
jgi:hypothetical protein